MTRSSLLAAAAAGALIAALSAVRLPEVAGQPAPVDAGPDAAEDDPPVRVAAVEEPAEPEPEEEERFGSEKLLLWSPSGRRTASFPYAAGEIRPDLEYYSYFAATDPAYERSNWMSNVHLEQRIAISRRVSIDSQIRLVLDSNGEDTRFYSDYPHEGVYLPALLGRVDLAPFELWAGKYEPAAGIRGHGPIFFGNYSRDLDLDGRIGGGASLTGGNDWLVHTLSAHLFRVDRSRLRGEIWSDRWRDDEHLAGAGPFGLPRSFLLTLRGTTPRWENRLAYTLGLGAQRRGSLPDERIALAALQLGLPIDGIGTLELSTDVMALENAGGYAENKRVLGPGIGLATAWFFVGVTYTLRRVVDRESLDERFDHIGELVARYYLRPRLTVEAAYQRLREDGETENALGAVIHYSADWLIH